MADHLHGRIDHFFLFGNRFRNNLEIRRNPFFWKQVPVNAEGFKVVDELDLFLILFHTEAAFSNVLRDTIIPLDSE